MTARPIGQGLVATGRIRPPGSKSVANRFLPLAAGARSPSRLEGIPDGDDVEMMVVALRALGAGIALEDGVARVEPVEDVAAARLDVGASGTTMRFLTAWAATGTEAVTLDGTARMRERPLGALCDALVALGAVAECASGFPPVTVRGPLHGGDVTVDASVSSQFASAVLMAAPRATGDVTVRVADPVSRPYLAATAEALSSFGIDVESVDGGWHVTAGAYAGASLVVPPDASGAVYPWVAAAVTGGDVVVDGLRRGGTQADLGVLDALEAMGCAVEDIGDGVRVVGPEQLGAIDVDLSSSPDGALAVAVACLFADGTSRLRGLGTLAVKETDRLTAVATELRQLGATVDVDTESLSITPGPLSGAIIATYDDHRMAMAFALAGLRVEGVAIADPECVSKTWPSYWDDMAGILHERVDVIAIDGPAGTGKTTVSQAVARRLGRVRLDTGAFYRAATLLGRRLGLESSELAPRLGEHHFTYDDGVMRLDGEDISEAIRSEAVTAGVSEVSAVPEVRAAMVDAQRRWVAESGAAVVVEGRDIGTVVFPGAITKVFLTASPAVRAARRAAETGADVAEEEVRIRRRDELDSGRAASPLRPATDAWILDTSDLGIDEVVSAVADHHLSR